MFAPISFFIYVFCVDYFTERGIRNWNLVLGFLSSFQSIVSDFRKRYSSAGLFSEAEPPDSQLVVITFSGQFSSLSAHILCRSILKEECMNL